MKRNTKTSTSRSPKRDTNHKKQATAGKVRIIGGQFKRRSINFIDADGLRPTPDRLRETLFNWLLADMHGARVLDSCAGSGVLGFEALSRGATHCTFIETNQSQYQMLLKSSQQLNIDTDSYLILHGNAEHVLSQNKNFKQPFDIVFIDPPYAKDLWQPILTTLIEQSLITTKTLIYLEADKDLNEQLNELAQSLSAVFTMQGLSRFKAIKQTKVGQVVAGLYRLESS
ncbi:MULTISPECIES: 16S rRNA (guanine(966)-N(2))-methyltransferase RsmD [unclassified Psychrobacter]|uniref:16S rRNA (guanine(966)-N(2))-methyltransferase RsmD n=1 Tax=unclassified Psychrobacter TaxID=196806 RepID=UPI00071E8A93|nr:MULTISPECIES: 16S rRNA (guanine(966)-N(2))-methyltransferase RsmD [unclassified Psychrobacter]OLF36428.1 16S rRNA (guanine(966)-N(2))-methyltransferase RsmD [Psychrobacter sp. Cmf 22.2]